MAPDMEKALVDKVLAMADDELILAHRNSQWTGHAPILEEDIAFANIAQDELGHARIWYELHQALSGKTPDELVFFRKPAAYRNVRLVELPRGDWAFTILRQYFFDLFESVRTPMLAQSEFRPLAEAAAKIGPEEIYHYRHSHAWLQRLGLGTEESNRRLQAALAELWPHVGQLFRPLAGEELLVEAGFVPAPYKLSSAWLETVREALPRAGLQLSAEVPPQARGREEHTPHLAELLAEMQSVARAEPRAEW